MSPVICFNVGDMEYHVPTSYMFQWWGHGISCRHQLHVSMLGTWNIMSPPVICFNGGDIEYHVATIESWWRSIYVSALISVNLISLSQ